MLKFEELRQQIEWGFQPALNMGLLWKLPSSQPEEHLRIKCAGKPGYNTNRSIVVMVEH